MSIMIISNDTIEKIGNSNLIIEQIDRSYINNDSFFKTIQDLYLMNVKSYWIRYSEEDNSDKIEQLYKINTKSTKKFNNKCELLKSLQCLLYNIELPQMDSKEKFCIRILKKWIKQLKDVIINELDDYIEARWE